MHTFAIEAWKIKVVDQTGENTDSGNNVVLYAPKPDLMETLKYVP